jgi:O-succinylbenzoic acid--CoA ligase
MVDSTRRPAAHWLLRADPVRPAVNDLTYGELAERALRARVPARARVAIAVPPGPDFAVLLHAIWLRGGVAVPHDLRLTPAERPAADHVIEELALGPAVQPEPLRLDAPAVALQTSGTTGAPKGVELTFANLLWSALGSAALLGVHREDRWLCALPLSHVGGLSILARSAIYGTAATILERWDTDAVAAELRSGRATLVSLVPTTLARLLDAGVDEAPGLRWALLGGAPVSPALRERAAALPVAETYGLTEAASQVTTFGVPLFCTRVELDGGEEGEILVSGPTVAGASPLRTGDLGRWRDGRLEISGRLADTIVTGGENVAPAEVEAVLERHPVVAEAAVFGRPDPEWGEAVCALVVARPGMTVDERDLRAHCARNLAGFKVPKAIGLTASLPRTPSGKLVRAALGSATSAPMEG